MLMVTIPKTTEVGDSVGVTINGQARTLELAYDVIRLDGADERRILNVIQGEENMTLICSDADGASDLTMIQP
jgi:hypothetical protein